MDNGRRYTSGSEASSGSFLGRAFGFTFSSSLTMYVSSIVRSIWSLLFGSSSSSVKDSIPVISLKVMVVKKNNQVVFAESDKDFIDLLFSFLTLPVGTIIRLLGEKSPPTVIGCMNGLYKSVENFDTRHFTTEVCKEMLLRPRKSSEAQCKNLKLQIEDNEETIKCYYICQNAYCREVRGLLSAFLNVRCQCCGVVMNQLATLSELTPARASCDEGGVFVKGGAERYVISDDLQVMPSSTTPGILLLEKLRIADASELESQTLSIGAEEVWQLFRFSLLSKSPLTHWILLKQDTGDLIELEPDNMAESLSKNVATNASKKISLKLFISKSRNKVLYAESREDFVDFLLSFLTFPLGSILKLLGGKSLLGCVDNLYKSVKDLSADNYLESEELKDMVLFPKLAPHFACENQLLQIEESSHPPYVLIPNSFISPTEWAVFPMTTQPDSFLKTWAIVNPKSFTGETTGGGGFVKGPAKFMVTDDFVVTQLSPVSCISFLGELKVPITDVDERVVSMGEAEALNLLRASLISNTALTDVFHKTAQSVSK